MDKDIVLALVKQLQDTAQFHDGNATVPGYVLEQLFLATGLEQEHYYTEGPQTT